MVSPGRNRELEERSKKGSWVKLLLEGTYIYKRVSTERVSVPRRR